MSALDSLIQNVYEYFQTRYGMDTGSLGPGSLFLAFEKLGTTLSASDFTLQPGDAEFNPAVVVQHGSDLADFVVQLDTEGFILPRADLSPTVSGQYSALLSDVRCLARFGADSEIESFLRLKGQAQKEFDGSKASMNLVDFWPANFTPQFWFNDKDPAIWSTYKFSTGQSTGPQPTVPPAISLGDWKWRVVTAEATPKWDSISKLQAMHTSEIRASLVEARVAHTTSAAAPEVNRPAAVMGVDAATITRVSRLAAALGTSARGTAAPSRAAPEAAGSAVRPLRQPVHLNPIFLKNALRVAVASQLPTQRMSSRNVSISFDYCLVNIVRPWLCDNLLNATQWYLPNKLSGDLAGGKYERTPKLFGLLPAKFIVIKNLTISAQWSEEDRTCVQHAASLGPLSLISKDFNGFTLASPGMQIIGWLCQVMPALPPAPDPAIANPQATSPGSPIDASSFSPAEASVPSAGTGSDADGPET